MSDVVKVLLWTLLAGGVAMAIAVGYGLFQLSQIYPDADEGKAIGEEIASELVADHPAFVVESDAEASFAEVNISITQDGGELTEPELSAMLPTLRDLVAEHADSRWDIDSTIEGRWRTSQVTITGSDADRWPELAPALELGQSDRAVVSVHLNSNRAVLNRDLDTERLCGAGTDPRDFYTDSIEEAADILTEVGWTDPEAPVLVYLGSGCEGPLRVSLDLSGPDRLERMEDLQTLVTSLPAEEVLVGATVRESGELQLALEQDVSDDLAQSLVDAWPHGDVWINGESVAGS